MANKPVSYLQIDSRWANNDYSAPGEKTTIGKAGCGPTSAAMVVAALADPSMTPATACAWSKANGYKALNQGTYYSFFTSFGKKYGLVWQQLNGGSLRNMTTGNAKPYHDKALQAIRDGHLVICCMGPGNWTSSGHYVLWWDLDSTGNVYINDPASTAAGRVKNTLARLQAEVKYYFICYTPEQQKEEKDLTETEVRAIVQNELQKEKERQRDQIDNTPDSYAKEAVDAAVAAGILKGNDKGNLMLHSPITRQDMLVMLDRAGKV